MCGILGQIRQDGRVDEPEFTRMLDTLSTRGPDGTGTKFLDGGRVALGHKRLSIIDLSESGAEPMPNEDGTVWLTFNGEIYNYLSLRDELTSTGHRFRSKTDSEVILHAYEQWGDDCVHRLRGIFAFGIWDGGNRRLLLARDHMGVKPLYYWPHGEGIIFASQPKAILASSRFESRLSPRGFSLYLAYGYVPGELSAYDGIAKIPAGGRYVWEQGRGRVQRYWHLEHRPEIESSEEAIARVREKISEAVRLQMVSDVPIGVFLSGGIDSSAVSAIVSSSSDETIRSFTIGFEDPERDERPFARLAADRFGTEHHESVLDTGRIADIITEHVDIYDEPFYDTSGFSTYMVSDLARRHDIKVILSGDGGDELFAGYRRYDWFLRRMAEERNPSSLMKRVRRWVRSEEGGDPVSIYFDQTGFFPAGRQRSILGSRSREEIEDHLAPLAGAYESGREDIAAAQIMDLNTYLVDDILAKVDRASMACGLEVRVPLLDLELVELAFTVASHVTYRNSERKWLLKRAASEWVPEEILTGRKRGFGVQLKLWMSEEMRDAAWKMMADGSLVSRGVLDPDGVRRTIARGKRREVWLLLAAELWARRWIEGEDRLGIKDAFGRAGL